MAKQWKQVQRADSDFSGNVTGTFGSKGLSDFYRTDNKPTKSDVGLGNLDNTKFQSGKFIGVIAKSDGTAVFDPSTGDFTGKIDGETASSIKTKASKGNDAKDAVDGQKQITMVGGSLSIGTQSGGVYPFSVDSSGNLKIQDDEFQALADGTVNCKGSFTIKQDANGDSKIVLEGDSTGEARVEVNGANPTFDLGGDSPLGTSSLYLRRGGTNNQARIQFRTSTGTGSNELNIGVSNNTINSRKDQYAIHYGPIWSSGVADERGLSFDHDGKIGMYANTKTVSGFTFGSDGTNKHVYIKDGGMGIGTTSISDDNLNVAGTVTANSFSGTIPNQSASIITSGGFTTDRIADSAITTSKIATGSVTQTKLAQGSVKHAALTTDAVEVDNIKDGAVSGIKLASGAIDHPSKLANGVVGNAAIDSNSVRADELAVTGNGTSSQFLRSDGDGTMTWATPSYTVNTDTNTTYSLDLTENNPDVTVSLNPSSGSTQHWNLTSEGSIGFNTDESTRETSVDVAQGGVTSAKLDSGAVTNAKIANGAVTGAKIANNTITGTQLNTYAVNTSSILGTAVVTNSKLGDNAVTPIKANLGWHTQTKIFVAPSEFVVNDDNAYGNLAIVDNGGQARVMYSAHEAYANVPIPSGYKVTHWRVNGTASVTVSLSYSTIATSTTTSCQAPAQQYTNTTNVTNPSSGISADDTNGRYMVIGWFPADTAKYLYGAVLTIAKI